MKERITLLGGEFYVGPGIDDGTLVLAEVPLKEPLMKRGFTRPR